MVLHDETKILYEILGSLGQKTTSLGELLQAYEVTRQKYNLPSDDEQAIRIYRALLKWHQQQSPQHVAPALTNTPSQPVSSSAPQHATKRRHDLTLATTRSGSSSCMHPATTVSTNLVTRVTALPTSPPRAPGPPTQARQSSPSRALDVLSSPPRIPPTPWESSLSTCLRPRSVVAARVPTPTRHWDASWVCAVAFHLRQLLKRALRNWRRAREIVVRTHYLVNAARVNNASKRMQLCFAHWADTARACQRTRMMKATHWHVRKQLRTWHHVTTMCRSVRARGRDLTQMHQRKSLRALPFSRWYHAYAALQHRRRVLKRRFVVHWRLAAMQQNTIRTHLRCLVQQWHAVTQTLHRIQHVTCTLEHSLRATRLQAAITHWSIWRTRARGRAERLRVLARNTYTRRLQRAIVLWDSRTRDHLRYARVARRVAHARFVRRQWRAWRALTMTTSALRRARCARLLTAWRLCTQARAAFRARVARRYARSWPLRRWIIWTRQRRQERRNDTRAHTWRAHFLKERAMHAWARLQPANPWPNDKLVLATYAWARCVYPVRALHALTTHPHRANRRAHAFAIIHRHLCRATLAQWINYVSSCKKVFLTTEFRYLWNFFRPWAAYVRKCKWCDARGSAIHVRATFLRVQRALSQWRAKIAARRAFLAHAVRFQDGENHRLVAWATCCWRARAHYQRSCRLIARDIQSRVRHRAIGTAMDALTAAYVTVQRDRRGTLRAETHRTVQLWRTHFNAWQWMVERRRWRVAALDAAQKHQQRTALRTWYHAQMRRRTRRDRKLKATLWHHQRVYRIVMFAWVSSVLTDLRMRSISTRILQRHAVTLVRLAWATWKRTHAARLVLRAREETTQRHIQALHKKRVIQFLLRNAEMCRALKVIMVYSARHVLYSAWNRLVLVDSRRQQFHMQVLGELCFNRFRRILAAWRKEVIMTKLLAAGCRNIAFLRLKERFRTLKANTLGVARQRKAVQKFTKRLVTTHLLGIFFAWRWDIRQQMFLREACAEKTYARTRRLLTTFTHAWMLYTHHRTRVRRASSAVVARRTHRQQVWILRVIFHMQFRRRFLYKCDLRRTHAAFHTWVITTAADKHYRSIATRISDHASERRRREAWHRWQRRLSTRRVWRSQLATFRLHACMRLLTVAWKMWQRHTLANFRRRSLGRVAEQRVHASLLRRFVRQWAAGVIAGQSQIRATKALGSVLFFAHARLMLRQWYVTSDVARRDALREQMAGQHYVRVMLAGWSAVAHARRTQRVRIRQCTQKHAEHIALTVIMAWRVIVTRCKRLVAQETHVRTLRCVWALTRAFHAWTRYFRQCVHRHVRFWGWEDTRRSQMLLACMACWRQYVERCHASRQAAFHKICSRWPHSPPTIVGVPSFTMLLQAHWVMVVAHKVFVAWSSHTQICVRSMRYATSIISKHIQTRHCTNVLQHWRERVYVCRQRALKQRQTTLRQHFSAWQRYTAARQYQAHCIGIIEQRRDKQRANWAFPSFIRACTLQRMLRRSLRTWITHWRDILQCARNARRADRAFAQHVYRVAFIKWCRFVRHERTFHAITAQTHAVRTRRWVALWKCAVSRRRHLRLLMLLVLAAWAQYCTWLRTTRRALQHYTDHRIHRTLTSLLRGWCHMSITRRTHLTRQDCPLLFTRKLLHHWRRWVNYHQRTAIVGVQVRAFYKRRIVRSVLRQMCTVAKLRLSPWRRRILRDWWHTTLEIRASRIADLWWTQTQQRHAVRILRGWVRARHHHRAGREVAARCRSRRSLVSMAMTVHAWCAEVRWKRQVAEATQKMQCWRMAERVRQWRHYICTAVSLRHRYAVVVMKCEARLLQEAVRPWKQLLAARQIHDYCALAQLRCGFHSLVVASVHAAEEKALLSNWKVHFPFVAECMISELVHFRTTQYVAVIRQWQHYIHTWKQHKLRMSELDITRRGIVAGAARRCCANMFCGWKVLVQEKLVRKATSEAFYIRHGKMRVYRFLRYRMMWRDKQQVASHIMIDRRLKWVWHTWKAACERGKTKQRSRLHWTRTLLSKSVRWWILATNHALQAEQGAEARGEVHDRRALQSVIHNWLHVVEWEFVVRQCQDVSLRPFLREWGKHVEAKVKNRAWGHRILKSMLDRVTVQYAFHAWTRVVIKAKYNANQRWLERIFVGWHLLVEEERLLKRYLKESRGDTDCQQLLDDVEELWEGT